MDRRKSLAVAALTAVAPVAFACRRRQDRKKQNTRRSMQCRKSGHRESVLPAFAPQAPHGAPVATAGPRAAVQRSLPRTTLITA